jgi:hypothetical protein
VLITEAETRFFPVRPDQKAGKAVRADFDSFPAVKGTADTVQ